MRHHDILGDRGLRLFPLFLFQVADKVVIQVRLACFLQCFEQEILIIDHELLDLSLVQPLMLELALVDFADASAVQILAGEAGEIVAEGALGGPAMAIARQCKLAELVRLDRLLSVRSGHSSTAATVIRSLLLTTTSEVIV